LETSKATCAAPLGEAPSLRRGRRPHHAGTERVGTWETSGRPRPPWRSRAWAGSSIERSRSGRPEESDGCVVPMKPRTRPIRDRRRRWWREGGRSGERRAAAHAPDPVPEPACPRGGEPADRDGRGRPSPPPRSRSTSDRSPVRESRTPGSARGAGRKARPYRDHPSQVETARLLRLPFRCPSPAFQPREGGRTWIAGPWT